MRILATATVPLCKLNRSASASLLRNESDRLDDLIHEQFSDRLNYSTLKVGQLVNYAPGKRPLVLSHDKKRL